MKSLIKRERAVEMYQGGASYKEIAAEMGATLAAVKSWFFRNRHTVPLRSRQWTERDINTARALLSAGGCNKEVAHVLSVQRGEPITNYDVNIIIACAASRDNITTAEWRRKYVHRKK